jgi:tetratricopeptide (TPR) repeat protein
MDRSHAAALARVRANPDDAATLAEVAPLLRAAQDWSMLTAVLEHSAELAATDRERLACWLELAGVYEAELSDLHEAEKAYARAAELDPSPGTLAALARVRAELA